MNDRTYLVQSLYWLHLHLCLVLNLNKKWTNELFDQFKCSSEKDSSDSSKESKSKDNQERKRVGSLSLAIDIPSKWVKFVDVDVEDSFNIQMALPIISLPWNAISKAGRGRSRWGGDLQCRNDCSTSPIIESKDNLEKMWGTKNTVSGQEAFQLNIILKSGQLVNTLVFQKDDKVYILSIEGDKETINDFLENMKDTWSLDEKFKC